MTQEDKQLLLRDLCARLPYGVKCRQHKLNSQVCIMRPEYLKNIEDVEEYEPYLRPMSSMTDEEENEYRAINCYEGLFPRNEEALDYVLEHHFDYRGLIEKDLALEAPEGMYKIE